LCAALLAWSCQRSRAQGINTPLCVFIIIVVTATGAAVVVRSCRPSWRCTSDPENPGTNWCSTMTRTAAAASGYVQGGPNYRTEQACLRICSTNAAAATPLDADPLLVVEKSTDLKTWTACGVMAMEFDGEIEWRDPEPMTSQCFYRVHQVWPAAVPARR